MIQPCITDVRFSFQGAGFYDDLVVPCEGLIKGSTTPIVNDGCNASIIYFQQRKGVLGCELGWRNPVDCHTCHSQKITFLGSLRRCFHYIITAALTTWRDTNHATHDAVGSTQIPVPSWCFSNVAEWCGISSKSNEKSAINQVSSVMPDHLASLPMIWSIMVNYRMCSLDIFVKRIWFCCRLKNWARRKPCRGPVLNGLLNTLTLNWRHQDIKMTL